MIDVPLWPCGFLWPEWSIAWSKDSNISEPFGVIKVEIELLDVGWKQLCKYPLIRCGRLWRFRKYDQPKLNAVTNWGLPFGSQTWLAVKSPINHTYFVGELPSWISDSHSQKILMIIPFSWIIFCKTTPWFRIIFPFKARKTSFLMGISQYLRTEVSGPQKDFVIRASHFKAQGHEVRCEL